MTKAFEAAHALKGTLSNLSITPLLEPVVEMTERFRNADEMVDVSDVFPQYKDALERFRALAE
ncbi:MAG: Hpt domain-containing protein [Mogibacterium sp.]|nr:Hpt domain-containing protein [Mogibacterium sp.]